MNKSRVYIPVVGFVIIVAVLALGFTLNDPHLLPSEMTNKPIAAFSVATLRDQHRLITNADLKGQISLLNVWATWCPNCVIEHPEMMRISREEDIHLIGVDYHDDRDKALAWLTERGDPYEYVIFDQEGRLGINLGVYGAPETYLVDSNGIVRFRHVGIVTRDVFDREFRPRIESLKHPGVIAAASPAGPAPAT